MTMQMCDEPWLVCYARLDMSRARLDPPRSFSRITIQPCPAASLLDLAMPDQSGLDVQSTLVEAGCHRPIIFLSGAWQHRRRA